MTESLQIVVKRSYFCETEEVFFLQRCQERIDSAVASHNSTHFHHANLLSELRQLIEDKDRHVAGLGSKFGLKST